MTHSVQFVNLERYLRKHMQDDSISVHNTVGPPCITIIFSLVAGPWPPTCAPSTSAPTTPSSTGTWHASTTSRGKSVRKWRRTGQVSGNHICIQGDWWSSNLVRMYYFGHSTVGMFLLGRGELCRIAWIAVQDGVTSKSMSTKPI